MLELKIICGIIAMLAAWALMFRKKLVYTFNQWMREYAFSDQWVIFSGTRVAALLFILGSLALFSGIDSITDNQLIKPPMMVRMLERARRDFDHQRLDRVVGTTQAILKSDPRNLEARELLVAAYFSLNKPDLAKSEIEAIVQISPNYDFRRGILAPYKIRVVKNKRDDASRS